MFAVGSGLQNKSCFDDRVIRVVLTHSGGGWAQSFSLSQVSEKIGLMQSLALQKEVQKILYSIWQQAACGISAGEGMTIWKIFFLLLIPLRDYVPLLIQVMNQKESQNVLEINHKVYIYIQSSKVHGPPSILNYSQVQGSVSFSF